MGKRLRDCNDAGHEKGLESDADRSIDCWLMLIHHPLPQSLRIWQPGVLQRSPSSENLEKMTDRNAIVTDWCLLAVGPVNSGFSLTH